MLTRSTPYQTGWNVTKWHACHAKQHDNLLGNLQNEHFLREFHQFGHVRHLIKQVGMSQSATPATQNNMTTCVETFERERFCGFLHRHGEATGKPMTKDETRGNTKKRAFRARPPPMLTCSTPYQTGWNVRKCHACHATQNNMTTCLETFEKERFCSFPHSHGEATGKPETRDKTRRNIKNQHFVRDFLQFSQFERCRTDKFCSFPHRHGDATRKTRDSRRDAWEEHQNEHLLRDFVEFSHFVASKSTFSYEFS